MYSFVSGIDFATFYDFDIWFCKCSDSVVFFLDHFSSINIYFCNQFDSRRGVLDTTVNLNHR